MKKEYHHRFQRFLQTVVIVIIILLILFIIGLFIGYGAASSHSFFNVLNPKLWSHLQSFLE